MENEPPEDNFQFDSIEILGLLIPILFVILAFYLVINHEDSREEKDPESTPKETQISQPVSSAS